LTYVKLDTSRIADWDSFHAVCQEAFGFPAFYGRNMDAWIDCLSGVRHDDGMTRFALEPDEYLDIEVPDAEQTRRRVPEIFDALIDCTAAVNRRYHGGPERGPLRLIFS
jgi:RNAse (barnase) inhibitor barstar